MQSSAAPFNLHIILINLNISPFILSAPLYSKDVSISGHLMRVGRAEVERDEGEPDDAGGVHCEPDKLRLVEVLGDLPGLDGVNCADGDEDHAVDLRSFQKSLEFPRNKYCTSLLSVGQI